MFFSSNPGYTESHLGPTTARVNTKTEDAEYRTTAQCINSQVPGLFLFFQKCAIYLLILEVTYTHQRALSQPTHFSLKLPLYILCVRNSRNKGIIFTLGMPLKYSKHLLSLSTELGHGKINSSEEVNI